ncbi:hypothetical protein [Taklimakanibacter albus]|uniref:Uncharacterized protein n=1 Tax=Taklimakanibacter albus TaxID=2800327 RepID=A0ACC5REN9_9HYPH|nr:hypothetical protein [Aestuariivirga sp. YIM B02566]MBK1871166.1 hypothetical protein [Aestuariivirga sp. YIM B02566]
MSAQFCPASCPLKLLDRKPERLVVTGLRCCMAGYAYGDIECWETAWRSYSMELGTDDARKLMGELQYWVRTLRAHSTRPLSVFPHGCGHVCRDECMALSLIAALQDHDQPAALLAARHLSGAHEGDAPLELAAAGRSYADALIAAGQKLLSVPASVIHSIAAFGSGPAAAQETLH